MESQKFILACKYQNAEAYEVFSDINKLKSALSDLKRAFGDELSYVIGSDITDLMNETLAVITKYESALNNVRDYLKKHDNDVGELFYKYNGKYLKSELKEDIKKLLQIQSDKEKVKS